MFSVVLKDLSQKSTWDAVKSSYMQQLLGFPNNWGLAPYDIYSVNGQQFICPFFKKVQRTKMLHAYLSVNKRGNG